jgi:hypothetical protein
MDILIGGDSLLCHQRAVVYAHYPVLDGKGADLYRLEQVFELLSAHEDLLL